MLKEGARRLLSSRVTAPLFRTALRPFAARLPDRLLRLVPAPDCVTARLPNGRVLRYGGGDDLLGKALYWRGCRYPEPETIDLVLSLAESCAVMLDIGASSGQVGLLAALSNPALEVHAFEPLPPIRERLLRNIAANGLRTVTAHPDALSDRAGSAVLHVPAGAFPTDASLAASFRERTAQVAVATTTVDAFVEQQGLRRVDLMKIDTESTEPEVLRGARRTLERMRPLVICEILRGMTEDRLHAVMDGQRYRYFWITAQGLVPRPRIEGDPAYRERNYLFVPEERAEQFAGPMVGVGP